MAPLLALVPCNPETTPHAVSPADATLCIAPHVVGAHQVTHDARTSLDRMIEQTKMGQPVTLEQLQAVNKVVVGASEVVSCLNLFVPQSTKNGSSGITDT